MSGSARADSASTTTDSASPASIAASALETSEERDIQMVVRASPFCALAVVAAVSLSLLVSITVIPSLANRLYVRSEGKPAKERKGPLTFVGGLFSGGIMGAVSLATRNWATRLATVVVLISLAAVSRTV